MTQTTANAPAPKDARFGALKGVFTPSILTILGVIMYLRFGWVVSNGGLFGAVLVVLLAHVISVTTGLSISSIATNRTVKAGGDYYMISRSLGMPIGGAIGVALFFALALSMSLYLVGFAESFLGSFGLENTLLNRRIVGSVACVALTALTFFSTSLALKIQYFVLAAIGLSLVSLFLGKSPQAPTSGDVLWFTESSLSFEVVFAVFFPAVTGFTAGVAMSGDLKDPRRAIPRGTLAAIGVGLLVYLAIPVYFAFTVDRSLLDDPMVWFKIARFPVLVTAGVFAATLSSALGSVLGAPRYLQALAVDGVAPRFLGKGFGPLNEPRIGTVVTFAIAEAGVLVGELDVIARVITMFFLTSYGFLCLACALQTWSGIASFRPDFRTPAWVSLLGALTCLAVMFKLDMVAMVAATAVMAAIYAFLKRRELRLGFGDTWGGFWAAVVQSGILRLHRRQVDSLNWRPNAIVFGGAPAERQHLIHMARWLYDDRGLSTYFYLIEGSIQERLEDARSLEPAATELVSRVYPDMLTRVSVCEDVYEGIRNVSQSYGLSGMTPNTVLMGWGAHSARPVEFTELVRDLLALDHNLLLVRHDVERSYGQHASIDIWWGGHERNGGLMLLLAYYLTSSHEWERAKLRINVIIAEQEAAEAALTNLKAVVAGARIRATANVILRDPPDRPIADIIATESAGRDLVIMGVRPPGDGEADFVERITELLPPKGTVLLVRGSTRFDGMAVLFDEG